MSYRVAAELSHRIAAMGGVAAQMVYEHCDPEYPVPIIHFHGLSDSTAPYQGIEGILPPVDSVMAIWYGINDCNSIPDTIFNYNGIIGKKWASSSSKSDVILYTISDFGHGWPVFKTDGISATDVMWDFFKVRNRIVVTAAEEDYSYPIPMDFVLYQNYPNPFNPTTKIRYSVPSDMKSASGGERSNVVLKVYDILGNEITTLVKEEKEAGYHSIDFNASDLSSGVYFYQLKANEFVQTRKMILMK